MGRRHVECANCGHPTYVNRIGREPRRRRLSDLLLRRLVRQELPEKAARAVYRLIYSFASWHQAHGKVLLDEIQNERQGAGP